MSTIEERVMLVKEESDRLSQYLGDLAPDGRRFVMIQTGEESAPPTQLRVVLNWFEELKAKVPTGDKR